MNAFLAQLSGFLNTVIGFLIVTFGVLVGISLVKGHEINGISLQEAAPIATATAAMVAIVIAVLLCGLIALLAEIKRNLQEMKKTNLERLRYSAELRSKSDPSL